MDIVAGWVVAVVLGVVLSSIGLGFLFTRCCIRYRSKRKKKTTPNPPTRQSYTHETQDAHVQGTDNYLRPILPSPSMSRANQASPHEEPNYSVPNEEPCFNSQNTSGLVDMKNKEGNTTIVDDYDRPSSRNPSTCVSLTQPPAQFLPLPMPVYDVPKGVPVCVQQKSPIILQGRGSTASSLKILPHIGNEVSFSNEGVTTMNIITNLSSLIPVVRQYGLRSLADGKEAAAVDEMETLQCSGLNQQTGSKRPLTIALMELDKDFLVKVKLNISQ